MEVIRVLFRGIRPDSPFPPKPKPTPNTLTIPTSYFSNIKQNQPLNPMS